MEENILEEHENTLQDGNDLIAIFCGGKLEYIPFVGEIYRFDESETPVYLMKCPPLGIIVRSNDAGQRIMNFHYDYNWLMFVIKHCKAKATTPKLEEKYKEICNSLTEFLDLINFRSNSEIEWSHKLVVDFIELFNKTK